MSKSIQFIAALAFIISVILFVQCGQQQKASTVEEKTKNWLQPHIISFQKIIKDTLLPLAEKSSNNNDLQAAFIKARQHYKNIEWAVEYFMPSSARQVNGPPVDEVETEENKSMEPQGLQVIEEFLYPSFDTGNRTELIRQCKMLQAKAMHIESHFSSLLFEDAQVMDALRLQVYRVATLGIVGFDAPAALTSINESAIALQSIDEILWLLSTKETVETKQLHEQIKLAISFCQQNKDFNSFDRLAFLTKHINNISTGLLVFLQQNNIAFASDSRVLKQSSPTLFADTAFNANQFIPSSQYDFSTEKANLGKTLFYSNLLSTNSTRNCASCHQPEKAFTDGLPKSASIAGSPVQRNAPTLTYATFQHGMFWDMRQTDLEAQAIDVISNKDEMHGDMQSSIQRIKKVDSLKKAFSGAFGKQQIEPWMVQNAIASYIRSLNKFNSRFDEYMKGNTSVMNTEEQQGFNLFMGKAKCGGCHFMPIFNGTVPPKFNKSESEVLGIPANSSNKTLDNDLGRYAHNQVPSFKRAFKIPTLRNIALTAPYMHNGVYATLEQVMDFYNQGGAEGLGITIENQSLSPDKLNLSPAEIKAVIAFMKTLSDK